MKKLCLLLLLFSGVAIFLSGCRRPAPNASVPTIDPNQSGPIYLDTATPTSVAPPPLTGDVQIQQLLLSSHTRWKTMVANATITNYPAAGVTAEPQIIAVRIWIEQPAKAKIISGPPQDAATHTFISDGKDYRSEGDPVQALPPFVLEQFNPPSGAPSDTVTEYPLEGMLGTPVAQMIFPAGLAQRGGEYRVTGQEAFANRATYVVMWGREPGQLIERFWVDTQTGVILKYQTYGKQGSQAPVTDMAIHFIQYDTAIPAETFDVNSPDIPSLATAQPTLDPNTPQLRLKADVDLVNVRNGPGTDFQIISTLAPKVIVKVTGKNADGTWYQVEVDGNTGWVFAELVDFSGDPATLPVVK